MESTNLPQTKPQGTSLNNIIPIAEIDINGADIDLVPPRILHKLRWRVKTHWLRIEQGGGKNRGMMAFQPG